MSYHPSHSRKDILDIIKQFKLPIEDPEDCNKKQLSDKLFTCLDTIDKIEPDYDYYQITTINELKEYLYKPNQKKLLSIKDKNEIMAMAKLIIQFCKAGHNINISYFDNQDDVYIEARRISQFGDIPSVRRMCSLLNKNPYSQECVYPIISQKVRKQLEMKKLTSKKIHSVLTVTHGKYVIDFN